jgi:hypothetical protein
MDLRNGSLAALIDQMPGGVDPLVRSNYKS